MSALGRKRTLKSTRKRVQRDGALKAETGGSIPLGSAIFSITYMYWVLRGIDFPNIYPINRSAPGRCYRTPPTVLYEFIVIVQQYGL